MALDATLRENGRDFLLEIRRGRRSDGDEERHEKKTDRRELTPRAKHASTKHHRAAWSQSSQPLTARNWRCGQKSTVGRRFFFTGCIKNIFDAGQRADFQGVQRG